MPSGIYIRTKKIIEKMKGHIPWNKGKKGVMPVPWNKGKKGVQIAWNKGIKGSINPNSGSFKKGQKAWNKGKKGLFKHSEEARRKIGKAATGENHYNWKGKTKTTLGYVLTKNRNHPFSNVAGYVYEHRLVMEKKLGRYLKPKEVVHHINHIVDDNRIGNLQLFENNSDHRKYHTSSKN